MNLLTAKFYTLATIVAVLLTFGAVVALAEGGPSDRPTSVTATEGHEDGDGGAEESESEADSPDDASGDVDQEEGGESALETLVSEADDGDGTGAERVAEAIAEEFEVTPEEVMDLHDQGIGFGALFKLYALANVMEDTTVQDLLADSDDGGKGYAFGQLKKSLTDEEADALASGPKNLGQLVSGSHDSNGHGPPDAAAAHGKKQK